MHRARLEAQKESILRRRQDGTTDSDFSECRGIFDEDDQIKMQVEDESILCKKIPYSYKNFKATQSKYPEPEQVELKEVSSSQTSTKNVEMVLRINIKDRGPLAITVFQGDKADDLAN